LPSKVIKRVVICPLDWGLGHATRCIPLIREFQNRGCEVFIASSGYALSLLKKEFPSLTFDELPAYNPHYSVTLPMTLSMALQLPNLLRVIRQEQKAIEEIVIKRKIDLVISDNRYGCWSKKVRSVFMTHQINLLVPWYVKKMVIDFSNKCIARFSLCWIPDWQGPDSIAGNLSKSDSKTVRYIGTLSRFKKLPKQEKRYDVLALISGPEPQRSELERILRKELVEWSKCQYNVGALEKSVRKCLLVRGIPPRSIIKNGDIDEVDYLEADELNTIMEASDVVICRSGYSTLMDLLKIGKTAILIPTPGQTEQEYLAEYLMAEKKMYCEYQHSFNLKRALEKSKDYNGNVNFSDDGLALKRAVDEVMRLH
jgi:spore coat polysaccharide biosynthesis predicted glycosyltransferase SpsG